MTQFGSELKRLRMERGWRQRDLVDALDGEMARSTLANIEAGRERPTERLWELLGVHLPAWRSELETHYSSARSLALANGFPARRAAGGDVELDRYQVGGPFHIESVQYVYTFRHSHAPEEIIEVRRVRAQRSGAGEYALKFTATDTDEFQVDEEALWGGYLTSQQYVRTAHQVHYLRQFRFGRRLRRGQTHDFALRSWVERDPNPDSAVKFSVTLPTENASVHLNFTGPERPGRIWSWGPLSARESAVPVMPDEGRPLLMSPVGNVSAQFPRPVQGSHYGITWDW